MVVDILRNYKNRVMRDLDRMMEEREDESDSEEEGDSEDEKYVIKKSDLARLLK